jgi:hypothetical protein
LIASPYVNFFAILPEVFFIISTFSIKMEESYFGEHDDAVDEQQFSMMLENSLNGLASDDWVLQNEWCKSSESIEPRYEID